ncbi:MAG: Swt1 family HEPN domain-containing protein [Bacteriovoracia bacterium]
MNEADLALYLMLGQTAQREVKRTTDVVPLEKLPISPTISLSELLPEESKNAIVTSEVFKLFYVFENYLRDLVLDGLSESYKDGWWEKIPLNLRQEIEKVQENDERKTWMAHSSRSKLDLATLPQLVAIMDDKDNWKEVFEPLLRDKGLIHETRAICHTRNLVCHMHVVTPEETERLKQVIRDWFRIVSP